MDDLCEAQAAFLVCDEFKERNAKHKGTSSVRTPGGRAFDWQACSNLALSRCKEVREEHADELLAAVRATSIASSAYDAAVSTCTRQLPGCSDARAQLHLGDATDAANQPHGDEL